MKATILSGILATVITAAAPSQAAVVFINFMTNQGQNAMNAAQATAIGASIFEDVSVQGTGGTQPRPISAGGVTGGVRYADWWQDGMKNNLYDAVARPEQGFTGGVVAINGTHGGTNPNGNASTITLGLTDYITNYITANSLTEYQVHIFYAGRRQLGQDALTDSTNTLINIDDGTTSISDYAQANLLTVPESSGLSFWSGLGAVNSFDSSITSLTINVASISGTTESGIAGIMIIPEPSTALLGAVGVLALLRRRR